MSDLNITIKVEGGSGGSTEQQPQETPEEEIVQGEEESVGKLIKKSVAATGVVSMGVKAVNHITSRVGVETGNRQIQDEINAAKQVGGQALMILGGFIAGGAVGGMAAIGGVVLDYALQYSDYAYAQGLEADVLSIRRERMGVGNMAISRSRAANQ